MFFDNYLPGGSSTPDSGGGLDPQALASNPILAAVLQENPDLLQQMMGGASSDPTQPQSLEEALIGSAMSVVGREGLTGKGFTGVLPSWAKDVAPDALGNPDFDPYLGVVSQQGDERVYMGDKPTPAKPSVPLPSRDLSGVAAPSTNPDEFTNVRAQGTPNMSDAKPAGHRDKTLTTIQATNLPYTWSEDEVADAMKRMRQAGIAVSSFDSGSNSLVSVWGSLVNRAAMTYSLSEGKRKLTPWDVLDLYKSESKAAGTYQDPNGTKTTTSRSVSELTEGQAWSVLRSTVSQMLGHDPSDQELRDYTYRMNQLAAQNPSISKTITKYHNGEAVSSSTHTSGGFTGDDAAQAAYEDAQSNPEYGAYQAATTYFNAAMSALGAIGG